MNIVLIDAEQRSPDGKILVFEWVRIKGTTIRYIHYEVSINFTNSCKNYLKVLDGTNNRVKGSRLKRKNDYVKDQFGEDVVVQLRDEKHK